MSTDTSSLHLETEELQRMLDGEGDRSEHEYAIAHLRTCTTCAAAMGLLEKQAELVSDWLRRAAFEDGGSDDVRNENNTTVATHWRFSGRRGSNNALSRGWLRAAAVLVLLGTPVAVSSTVRGWIAERLSPRPVEQVTEVVADPVPAVQQAAGVIRFAPAAGDFDVVFASMQQDGTLEVVAGRGSEAVLEINGVAGAGPVVSEYALRINNERASTANYILRVPDSVTRVTIRVPGRTAQNLDAAELRQGVQISLAR